MQNSSTTATRQLLSFLQGKKKKKGTNKLFQLFRIISTSSAFGVLQGQSFVWFFLKFLEDNYIQEELSAK